MQSNQLQIPGVTSQDNSPDTFKTLLTEIFQIYDSKDKGSINYKEFKALFKELRGYLFYKDFDEEIYNDAIKLLDPQGLHEIQHFTLINKSEKFAKLISQPGQDTEKLMNKAFYDFLLTPKSDALSCPEYQLFANLLCDILMIDRPTQLKFDEIFLLIDPDLNKEIDQEEFFESFHVLMYNQLEQDKIKSNEDINLFPFLKKIKNKIFSKINENGDFMMRLLRCFSESKTDHLVQKCKINQSRKSFLNVFGNSASKNLLPIENLINKQTPRLQSKDLKIPNLATIYYDKAEEQDNLDDQTPQDDLKFMFSTGEIKDSPSPDIENNNSPLEPVLYNKECGQNRTVIENADSSSNEKKPKLVLSGHFQKKGLSYFSHIRKTNSNDDNSLNSPKNMAISVNALKNPYDYPEEELQKNDSLNAINTATCNFKNKTDKKLSKMNKNAYEGKNIFDEKSEIYNILRATYCYHEMENKETNSQILKNAFEKNFLKNSEEIIKTNCDELDKIKSVLEKVMESINHFIAKFSLDKIENLKQKQPCVVKATKERSLMNLKKTKVNTQETNLRYMKKGLSSEAEKLGTQNEHQVSSLAELPSLSPTRLNVSPIRQRPVEVCPMRQRPIGVGSHTLLPQTNSENQSLQLEPFKLNYTKREGNSSYIQLPSYPKFNQSMEQATQQGTPRALNSGFFVKEIKISKNIEMSKMVDKKRANKQNSDVQAGDKSRIKDKLSAYHYPENFYRNNVDTFIVNEQKPTNPENKKTCLGHIAFKDEKSTIKYMPSKSKPIDYNEKTERNVTLVKSDNLNPPASIKTSMVKSQRNSHVKSHVKNFEIVKSPQEIPNFKHKN